MGTYEQYKAGDSKGDVPSTNGGLVGGSDQAEEQGRVKNPREKRSEGTSGDTHNRLFRGGRKQEFS